jgi:hypothetical protein
MWEVPQTSLESRGLPDLADELLRRHGLEVVPGSLVVRVRHAITFRRIQAEGYRARLRRLPAPDAERLLWARPEDLASLPVSSLTRKLIGGLRSAQLPLLLDSP